MCKLIPCHKRVYLSNIVHVDYVTTLVMFELASSYFLTEVFECEVTMSRSGNIGYITLIFIMHFASASVQAH